jgi:hypothetical protein
LNRSQFNKNYHQGYYSVINKDKYIGDLNRVIYRSSWEEAFCRYLDGNEKILKWSCEHIVITYNDLRGKSHRYYPDYYYQMMIDNDPNQLKHVVVELKPYVETIPPVKDFDIMESKSKKKLENYSYAVTMYTKNLLKWNSAIQWCQDHHMEFIIVTEKHLKKIGILKS